MVHRSIGETLRDDRGQDSPVMNETLNEIDEHITDLSTPRQSLAPQRTRDDSESDYSSQLERKSFVAGPETDEEDNAEYDEITVRSWDHITVAQHLKEIGVEPKHCEIFKEQEISGDVLLDMDQNFIYMKDFDFGVMGRRLKTWHKVRDFQRDVKLGKSSRRTSDRDQNSSLEDIGRSSIQGLSSKSSLSRLQQDRGLAFRQTNTPPIFEEHSDMPQPLQPQQNPKRQSWAAAQTPPTSWRATLGPESPTTAMHGQNNHSRRHSSIDFGTQPDLELSSLASSHQKRASTEKTWSLAGSTLATSTPPSSIKPLAKTDDTLTISSPVPFEETPHDFDRGYFSGNEIDNRKTRNRLSKQSSPRVGHSRQTSLNEQSKRSSMMKRHNRLSSVGSLNEEPDMISSDASKSYHTQQKKGRLRSASERATSNQPAISFSPTVTNLENDSTSNISAPTVEKKSMQNRARKLMGFRVASEAVTPSEKSNAIKLTPSADTTASKSDIASPATGSTTPSATPSFEIDSPVDGVAPNALSKNSARPRPKNKQRTSAYTHGLLKIPPAEARKHCDHHGWMKKKASGIMSTWKVRLFILRGRRLSYYYSEDDTEERGIIDISGHKVLVANDDPLVTLHASVTGAASKSSPNPISNTTSSPVKTGVPASVFYFKLVPPRSGLSRAVQFTKPAVHYFQVDSITEGRKWMGEIMKATIEHDLTSFETTNKQKTISLAKARARRERPPALGDTKASKEPDAEGDTTPENGLNIQGLELSVPNTPLSENLPLKAVEEEDKENALATTARTSAGSGTRA